MATLTIHITRNENYVLFDFSHTGNKIQEFTSLLDEIRSLILSAAFGGRDAISIVQPAHRDDCFDDLNYTKKEFFDGDTKYLILSSSSWDKVCLKRMAIDFMEYELGMLWFVERKAEEALKETIKLIGKLHLIIEAEKNLELFGCVCDGEEIIWLNPNLEFSSKVFQALHSLPEVAVIFK